MSERDWDAEMRKIDRHIEAVPDAAPLPATGAKAPASRAPAEVGSAVTSGFGVFARLALAVTLGVAINFWPYGARCGLGLAIYLGAVATLITAGGWASVWTWRHRAAKAHTLSLLLVLWGLLLAALDVLPRAGYARATPAHPAQWACP